jgi:fibro-slime domain-containing protein
LEDSTYFPLDGLGWEDTCATSFHTNGDPQEFCDGEVENNNFFWTSEYHMDFKYTGQENEIFEFRGDDDVFVYINRKLAVDLGGLHGPETGSINLKDREAELGIEVGQTYPIDIYHAERCPSGSNFKLELKLTLNRDCNNVCKSWGDPHVTNFNCNRFDHMGLGYYNVAKYPPLDFIAQTAQHPQLQWLAGASCNVAFALQVGELKFVLVCDQLDVYKDPLKGSGTWEKIYSDSGPDATKFIAKFDFENGPEYCAVFRIKGPDAGSNKQIYMWSIDCPHVAGVVVSSTDSPGHSTTGCMMNYYITPHGDFLNDVTGVTTPMQTSGQCAVDCSNELEPTCGEDDHCGQLSSGNIIFNTTTKVLLDDLLGDLPDDPSGAPPNDGCTKQTPTEACDATGYDIELARQACAQFLFDADPNTYVNCVKGTCIIGNDDPDFYVAMSTTNSEMEDFPLDAPPLPNPSPPPPSPSPPRCDGNCFTSCDEAKPHCETQVLIRDNCPVACGTGAGGNDKLTPEVPSEGILEYKVCFHPPGPSDPDTGEVCGKPPRCEAGDCFMACADAKPHCESQELIRDSCPVTCNTGKEGADMLTPYKPSDGTLVYKVCFYPPGPSETNKGEVCGKPPRCEHGNCYTSCSEAEPYCESQAKIRDNCPVTCNTGMGSADLLTPGTPGMSAYKVCFYPPGPSFSNNGKVCGTKPTSTPPSPPPFPPRFIGGQRDPHLFFAHGGRADLKGEHKTWYNMLSAKNTSVNVLFEFADFNNPHRLVHGSFMSRMGMTMRTSLSGQLVTLVFSATVNATQAAHLRAPSVDKWLTHESGMYTLENLNIGLREKKLGGFIGSGLALVVETGLWEVVVWSKPFPNAAANPGKALLNLRIDAKYDADHDVVAPHGIIGQSYDGDSVAIDGALDDYSSAKEMTTKAMAEGAIEGEVADYKMPGPFATEYKYSRFDATKAQHRDVSKLSGKKEASKKSGHGTAGAAPDVEE